MSPTAHAAAAAELARREPVRCAVLTISDTRTIENDDSGATIVQLLEQGHHRVVDRGLVRDDPPTIRATLEEWIDDPRVQAILTTGGTGIARRDGTVDVVRALLTAELEGFGELFRVLSYERVGAAAMLSRAVGGIVVRGAGTDDATFVFAMPGSVDAVTTAMERLIVPELAHLVWERRRG
ncbi:MAG: MogA/MoaB family molybdenum cofactor biosynthesis protein [Phycisphaerales bacterium]